MSTRLERIRRYPLKGFAGQDLPNVRLTEGQGAPYDRQLAIVSGNRPETPGAGQWVPSRAYIQNTVFDDLLTIDCTFDADAGIIYLKGPAGRKVRIELGVPSSFSEANGTLGTWFEAGPHANISLVEQGPRCGFWDYTDSTLSIINLATIRYLEQAAGRPLDPVRFRGNFYIDGLEAWEEFAWPGKTVRIGETLLEIIRPILRCAATSVDPLSGARDFNLPGFMQQAVGHCFCGVYAKVLNGGDIAAGDPVLLSDTPHNPVGPQPDNAPARNLWPRFESVHMELHNGEPVPVLDMPYLAPDLQTGDEPNGNVEKKVRLHMIGAQSQDQSIREWVSCRAIADTIDPPTRWIITPPDQDTFDEISSYAENGIPLLISGPI